MKKGEAGKKIKKGSNEGGRENKAKPQIRIK